MSETRNKFEQELRASHHGHELEVLGCAGQHIEGKMIHTMVYAYRMTPGGKRFVRWATAIEGEIQYSGPYEA